MKVYRPNKAIDNEKLDLDLVIGQLKKKKEKLSQSLKRRKDLAVQINENIYTKKRIEDIYPKRKLDEVDDAIKDLLENNYKLQEEIKKL